MVLATRADGRLHLSATARLAPHHRDEDSEALLARAVHKSRREMEVLVAELAPHPEVPALMRQLRPWERRLVVQPHSFRAHSYARGSARPLREDLRFSST